MKPGVGLQLSQHICGAREATGSPGAKVRWIYGVSYWRIDCRGCLGGGKWDGGLDTEVHRGRGSFLGRGRREVVVSGGAGEPSPMPPWRGVRYLAAASPTSSLTPCVGRSRRE